MRHWKLVLALAALLLTAVNGPALAADGGDERVLARDDQGIPTFLRGELGNLGDGGPRRAAERYLAGLTAEAFSAGGGEEFEGATVLRDPLGQMHIRVDQRINGLRVLGAQLIVHTDRVTRDVLAVNGKFVPSSGLASEPAVGAREAMELAVADAGILEGKIVDEAELVYVLDPQGRAQLAWRNLVQYENEEGVQVDHVFADALKGFVVTRHPTLHRAKSWRTYDANSGTSIPGSLRCTNGSCSGADAIETTIDDNTSDAYDYLNVRFGRDSFDGSGATIDSVAHFSSSYVNAFWCNNTITCPGWRGLVYGDGDGVNSGPLGNAFDVVAHELGHGVTDFSSDLIYQNESGALNEAMSDITAAGAEAWLDGGVSADTWKVGEDTWTPGISGDALRYMDDPTQDGSSFDYYPSRYTGTADNGGVHWNSGIANLAFYLLSQGGTHPQGATSNTVPALGIATAEQIFYRANTVYMGPSSTFADARTATANAADDLYGTTEVDAVHEAWDAVGVPGGGPPPSGCQPGDTVYAGTIGAGQSHVSGGASASGNLRGDLTGSAPDLDLYLEQESCSWWSCSWGTVASSLSASSTESINVNVGSGTYRWRVFGFSGSGITYQLCVNNGL